MMTTTPFRNRRLKAHDRLLWMEGVKIIKPSQDGEPNFSSQKVTLGKDTRVGETRSSSLQRGTDGGTAREGGETERGESEFEEGSRLTGTVLGREVGHSNLGEELTSVVRKLPRINFEKVSPPRLVCKPSVDGTIQVHVAGRTCTVSLYSPTFLRATFTFPKSYPHVSPTIDLERNLAIPLKTRAFLLASLRKLMAKRAEKGLGSLELALKFLAGEKGDEGGMRDEDEDEEGEREGERDEGRTTCIVPPPARGGAVFGPQGESQPLVVGLLLTK